MVSTRHHPKQFPEPTTPGRASPTKQTASTASTATSSPPKSSPVEKTPAAKTPARRRTAAAATSSYVHTPDPITIGWLLISLILVAWDTGYVFLRPHSMTGGFLNSPLWTPYQLYATVDHMYGFPAWHEGNGFTAAQAALNFVESIMYIYYLVICWNYGGGAKGFEQLFRTGQLTVQGGPPNAVSAAVLVCFSSAVMTVSKTALYWLNEAFSNFHYIGHNDPLSLFMLWIIPNGLWLVFPSYIAYYLGKELVEALDSKVSKTKSN